LPIILSAPHGGNWSPDSIPDRDCSGCSYTIDSYTRVITWGIYDEIFAITGCYPHVIMNRLHRRKFDANRDIGDAADGNPLIEEAWANYHDFVDTARIQIEEDYGRGLFLDIHGHGHTIQRIELGYLLSKSELELSDAVLNTNTYIEESSIRTLVGDNISSAMHADLLRGSDSFGTLMDEKGFPSVPSDSDPSPSCSGSCYFSGGYNTVRHGSRDNLGDIDAIQVELDSAARSSDNRSMLIDSIALSILEYIDLHYNAEFIPDYCSSILPVELIEFNAKYLTEKRNVHLSWTTAIEINNNYFAIEKSLDADSWKEIGTVSGNGNTAEKTYYEITDENPIFGEVNYYRLKQVDFDGSFHYSSIKSTVPPNTSDYKITIFPNPVNENNNISFTNEDKIKKIRLYSITGAEINIDGLSLPSSLSKGVFLLAIELKTGEMEFVKLIVR